MFSFLLCCSSHQYGLKYDRKFTEAHFAPDAHSRMRVRPAAQNLSATMARWVLDDVNKNGKLWNTSLAMYCSKTNRYFDIMNGKDHPKTGATGVIWGPSDPKLAELEEFARWFEDWSDDLTKRGLTKKEQDDSFISRYCYFDLRLAVHGFVSFVKYYTSEGMPGEGRPVYPQYFNQDMLEHHFRNIRGANGDQRHPTAAAAANAAQNGVMIRFHRDGKSNSGHAPVFDIDQPLIKREGGVRGTRQVRPKVAAAAAPPAVQHAAAAAAADDDTIMADDAAAATAMPPATLCDATKERIAANRAAAIALKAARARANANEVPPEVMMMD